MDGKPIVSRLEEFGTRVLNNVWTAIKKNYIEEVKFSSLLLVYGQQTLTQFYTAFAPKLSENDVGYPRFTKVRVCVGVTVESHS